MDSASSSSVSFFETRSDVEKQQQQQQERSSSAAVAAVAVQVTAPAKKRRNLSGNLYPDAEVIALSPNTLQATNRYVCDVCNKGFQREQNLQLHRRGHNLPWKLRQKNPKEVRRRRVYLCPEPTCVHHDPSRPLGDLTGVKKHFSRKHGKKKWKCEKCSKMYAVQSDWKAHSKTCGTREYRCDCGTIFSRRDSFITHRAFCDAIALQSSRLPISLASALINTNLYGNDTISRGLLSSDHDQVNFQLINSVIPDHDQADMIRCLRGGTGGPPQFNDHVMSDPNCSNPPAPAFHPPRQQLLSSAFHFGTGSADQQNLVQIPDHHHLQINSSGSSCAANLFNGRDQNYHLLQLTDHDHQFSAANLFSSNYLMGNHIDRSFVPRISADDLQMGTTTSINGGGESSMFINGSFRSSTFDVTRVGEDYKPYLQVVTDHQTHLQDLIMNSFANGSTTGLFGGSVESEFFDASLCQTMNENKINLMISTVTADGNYVGGSSDHQLTRDFLGVGAIVTPGEHHGAIDRSSMNADMKSAVASSRHFAGVNLQ